MAEITIPEALDRLSGATKNYIDVSISNAIFESEEGIKLLVTQASDSEVEEMLNEEFS